VVIILPPLVCGLVVKASFASMTTSWNSASLPGAVTGTFGAS
jgi:hypothetical protein